MRLKLDENLDNRGDVIRKAGIAGGKIWIVEPGRVRIWESWEV